MCVCGGGGGGGRYGINFAFSFCSGSKHSVKCSIRIMIINGSSQRTDNYDEAKKSLTNTTARCWRSGGRMIFFRLSKEIFFILFFFAFIAACEVS